MYRFRSSLNRKTLNAQYKALYVKARLQSKWNNELSTCPELAQTLPPGKSPEDLLTMSYEELVDVYLLYRRVFSGLPVPRQIVLTDSAKRVFSYDSYKTPIARFLANPANGFEIYTCVYCDLTDVRTLPNGKRQFDTEHILDRGECPLVGLSLYNFCPSCGFCNTNCKHSNPIGKTPLQMKKLGPTSEQYDFEHQVRFVLKTDEPQALGRINLDHLEWYNLDFEYKDDDYKEVVSLFDLIIRYNQDPIKQEALDWRAKAIKNHGIAIAFTAWLHGNSVEAERKRVLHFDRYQKAHVIGLKMIEDMIMI